MFDNFLRHKILGDILHYKSMFYFKKDVFISLVNFHEFFPKTKNFDRAFISLVSKGYITAKEEDGIRKVNIEKEGVFAFSNDTLRKEQYKIWWAYIKDGLTLFATLLMAWIAIIALNRDTSKFVEKSQLKELQKELLQLQTQASKTDSLLRIYQTDIENIRKFSPAIDTPALKQNTVDKIKKPKQ